MLLILTPKSVVDSGGVTARFESEISQGLPDIDEKPIGHTDLGLVIYAGMEYYASLYEET